MHNRLYHVNDSESSGLQSDDIDDQGAFNSTIASMNTANNYSYDEIGNLAKDSTEEIDTILWTVGGKIKEIQRVGGSSKKNVKFEYDASGNRISKQVLSSSNSWEKTTFYVRDPKGNIMSTYEEVAGSYLLKEQHLYGGTIIGMYQPEKEMIGADTTNEFAFDTLNKRVYELSNHLQNILLVTYDRKIALDTNSDGHIDFRQVDISSTQDFAAFGSKLYNRGLEIKPYRTSFNGKEDDKELGTQDYGLRIYNPALGKFLSVDPLISKFAFYSPYQFAGNKPINSIDLDGAEDQINIVNRFPSMSNISTTFKGDIGFETTKQKMCETMGINASILPKSGTFTMQVDHPADNKPNNITIAYTPTVEVFAFKDNMFVRGLKTSERVMQKIQGKTYGEGEDWIKSANAGAKASVSTSKFQLEIEGGFYSTSENNVGLYLNASFNASIKGGTEGSNVLKFMPEGSASVFATANTTNQFNSEDVNFSAKNTTSLMFGASIPLRGNWSLTGKTDIPLDGSKPNTSFGIDFGTGENKMKAEGGIINETKLQWTTGTKDISGH